MGTGEFENRRNGMIIRELDQFNLRQIAQSGQCFRMTEISLPETMAREAMAAEVTAAEVTAAEVTAGGVTAGGVTAGKVTSGKITTGDGATGEDAATRADIMAFRVLSGARAVTVAQRERTVVFFCEKDEFPYWENYFDLRTDYGEFIASVDEKDEYLRKAAAFGSGIRILRQDLWEMIVTFIISQQKTIPAIRALVEKLSERYGSRIEGQCGNFYAFPSPEQLSRATLEELRELKLGYRAEYIYRICRDACSGALDLEKLRACEYPDAMAYLTGFYGIGMKVANCVCLFGLHHIDAFPVDTWIRRVLMGNYACRSDQAALNQIPESRRCDFLVKEYFSGYRGYAGVMQQYIFYYERYSKDRLAGI